MDYNPEFTFDINVFCIKCGSDNVDYCYNPESHGFDICCECGVVDFIPLENFIRS